MLNPGDLRWDPLSTLGDFTVHERTHRPEIVDRSREAPILLTNKTPLDGETIGALPALRYIGVLATGYNIVDMRAALARGITVTNVPAYATMSVAQAVFAHLFMLTHRMDHHTGAVRLGRWSDAKDFSFRDYPLVEVSGRTMGIIGYGRIGRAVAHAARAFGMEVLVSDGGSQSSPAAGVRRTSLAEIFSKSDVVSLHCPLTPATQGMVNRERLALMKPTAYLINTSRGPLVDEHALAEALNAGRIAGAGLDVLSIEPPPPDNPLLHAKNCCITPHFAWGTVAARERLLHEAAENVRAFLAGKERNIVTA
jgi:glycerate dehydrogenase